MSTATQSAQPQTTPLAAVWLRCLLAFLAVGCVADFWYSNAHTEDFQIQFPLFTPWLWNLYLTFYLVSLFALFTLWNWQKWGLWLLTAMGVAIILTEIYAMPFALVTLRIPAAMGVVWYAARRVGQRLQ